MNKHFIKYNTLVLNAANYLLKELNYSVKTVHNYEAIWKKIRAFMFSNNFKSYNRKVGEKFILHNFGTLEKKKLKNKHKVYFNAVTILNQFYLTGKIKFPVLKSKYPLKFEGSIGFFISQFINLKITKRMSRTNLQEHQRNLFNFLEYCKKKT